MYLPLQYLLQYWPIGLDSLAGRCDASAALSWSVRSVQQDVHPPILGETALPDDP